MEMPNVIRTDWCRWNSTASYMHPVCKGYEEAVNIFKHNSSFFEGILENKWDDIIKVKEMYA